MLFVPPVVRICLTGFRICTRDIVVHVITNYFNGDAGDRSKSIFLSKSMTLYLFEFASQFPELVSHSLSRKTRFFRAPTVEKDVLLFILN